MSSTSKSAHSNSSGQAAVSWTRVLSHAFVEELSSLKGEPQWMKEFRFRGLDALGTKTWSDVDGVVGDDTASFDKRRSPGPLPSPASSASEFQSDALSAFHSYWETLKRQGVIFVDTDTAVREHPDLIKKFLGMLVEPEDSPAAALNAALWSGGVFIYVPAGVKVAVPLQTSNQGAPRPGGPFERTLVIAEPGSRVHYIEGCTAPIHTLHALRSTVVEVLVKEGARVRYTSMQNWSRNVRNLSVKRAAARKNAAMTWTNVHLGAGLTVDHPTVILQGPGARADVFSLAFAEDNQRQDLGGALVFETPGASGGILSRSVLQGGGWAGYRARVTAPVETLKIEADVQCDALVLDSASTPAAPSLFALEGDGVEIGYHALVSRLDERQVFYMMSRGLAESEARGLIVAGLLEPVLKQLPIEYAVELETLIALRLQEAVG